MLEAIMGGLRLFATGDALLAILIALPIGLVFGILPGLSGLTALAVLVPFVYGMEPFVGLTFLIAAHAVTATSGAVPSILIGIPGTPPSAATVIDGYPLAKQGRGGYACGAALFSSAVGGVIGCAMMALILPILQPIILSFGSPETFVLIVIGLLFLASVGSSSIWKGLIAGILGIFLSFVGYEAVSGVPRFWLGSEYFLDGLPLIPLALGLFAIPEIIELTRHGKPIAIDTPKGSLGHREIWRGAFETIRYWKVTLQSSLIGVLVGLIPGVGGETAPFVAYGAAQKMSKTPKLFGHGAIEGVLAPEATNNSKEGGALVPTLALGIPGGAGMAVLLGAFIVLGIQPGPEFMRNHMDIGMGLAIVLGFVNIVAALAMMLVMPYIARVTQVPGRILAPLLMVLVVLGAYTSGNNPMDVVFALLFGAVGYVLKNLNFSRAALLLGFVLGATAERYLSLSLNLYGIGFVLRPITLTLIVLAVAALAYPHLIRRLKGRRDVQG